MKKQKITDLDTSVQISCKYPKLLPVQNILNSFPDPDLIAGASVLVCS